MAGMLPPGGSLAIIKLDEKGGNVIRYVYADMIEAFGDEVIGGVMDGLMRANPLFALGAVAMVNAISHDEVDWSQPALTVELAWQDVNDVTTARAHMTDALSAYCERSKAGHDR